ncbi:MAG: hypothetical protein GF308_11045 [Candidatus Heimdallarchaeota archaeon]|nr:hypothetical protein [Candidatus Heimdallarchaeota archaeon]
MKKLFKTFIPIALISILLCTTLVRGDYQVSVGSIYTYDVNTSNWSLKFGSNSADGQGYPIEDGSFQEGTNFDVEVTAVNPTVNVDWTMSKGTKEETGSSTGFDYLGIILYCFYPLLLASGISSGWNATEVEMGPEIITMFFFDTAEDVSFEFFRMLSNTTGMSSALTESEYSNLERMEGHFDESGSVAVFDWVIEGQIVDSSVNTDLEGSELFQIAYDKSTGVLQGYHIKIDFKGSVEGSVTEMELEQKVEITGYNLPAFYYGAGGGLIPGFEWFIGIFSLSCLAVPIIIIRKRKQK